MTFGVIFDNDGVLVDTEHFSIEAYRRAIEEQGVKLCDEDNDRNCGLTDADIIRNMKEMYGADLDLELFSRRKIEHYEQLAGAAEIRVFAGARELIEALRAEDVPYAVASSGSRSKIAFNLDHAGISNLFPVIVSGEDFRRGKPDPEIVIRSAEKLGLAPESCVVIEDSINGLKAAHAAGAVAIGITNTFPADKLQPHADEIIDSLAYLTPARLKGFIHRKLTAQP